MWLRDAGHKKVRGELPEIVKLSPSTMKMVFECECCLYKHVRGYRRPSFPVAGITHAVDRTAKALCDMHRTSGTMPLMLRASLEGLAPEKPKTLNWTDDELKCTIVGKLDELVIEKGGAIAPLDHKSCNLPPLEVIPSVQLQLDTYALLLSRSPQFASTRVSSFAFLLYHFPRLEQMGGRSAERGGCPEQRMGFASELRRVPVDPERAYNVIREVLDVVRGPKPPLNPECAYCCWTLL